MSRSDWGKLLKTVGLASAAFLIATALYVAGFYAGDWSGYYEGQQYAAARQYPSDTQRIVDDCFKLPTRAETTQCVSEAYQTSHENQRAEKDTKTQRDMSDWAWWVMIIGLLQFFATIVTLGFVKLTLDATLEAVNDTSEATEAMREANKIAKAASGVAQSNARMAASDQRAQVKERRASERRQLRAYVDFESVEWTMIQKRKEPNTVYRGIRVILKNYGQTPADKLTAKAVFFLERNGTPEQIAVDTKEGLGGIMPGDAFRSQMLFPMDELTWNEIGDEHLFLVVSIHVAYEDAFGDPHTLSSIYRNDGWQPAFGFVPGSRMHS